MKTFLEKEYLPHARKYPGIYGLPDAEKVKTKISSPLTHTPDPYFYKVYAENIYQCTTYRYTPEEIHSIGLKEVERIWKLMQETQLKMQPDMSIEEFRDALKDKSKFPELWFDDADMIIPTYELLLQRINSAMPYFFKSKQDESSVTLAD